MAYVNVWIAISQQALNEFKSKESLGDTYTGPMDNVTYNILNKMADRSTVQSMFKSPTIGGKVYHLFSLYLNGTAKVAEALDYLATTWPNNFIVIGAWFMDGTQVGGATPLFPIPDQAWRLMPDTFDIDGNPIPATSNADLQDINLLQGQSPRIF